MAVRNTFRESTITQFWYFYQIQDSDVNFNSSRDMYLDPIETMKRPQPPLPASAPPSTTLKSENKYSVMENRESYIPSDGTMKRFNVSNYHNLISKNDENII